jgi:hypothetical protein
MTDDNNVVQLRSTAQSKPTSDPIPEFINPANVLEMDDEKLDALLEGLRFRRLEAQRQHQAIIRKKQQAESEAARAKLEKKAEQFVKKYAMIGKHLEALEKYLNELRGLALQANIDIFTD